MKDTNKKGASVFQVARAVFGAFTGIRKKSDHENDAANLKPAQVIIGGIIGAVLFVGTILFVVKIIVD